MPGKNAFRTIAGLVRPDYLEERIKAGWRLVGWNGSATRRKPRPRSAGLGGGNSLRLQVSDDCTQLVGNPPRSKSSCWRSI